VPHTVLHCEAHAMWRGVSEPRIPSGIRAIAAASGPRGPLVVPRGRCRRPRWATARRPWPCSSPGRVR